MLRTNPYLWAVGAICGLLLAGCRSAPSPKHSAQRDVGVPAEQTLPVNDAALQKLAEAHAHYAAGVVHEVDEQPEAALKQYYQAALKDPGNETLILDVARRFLQNKQPEQALEILNRAAARPNASGMIFARLGFVYAQLGKFDQAIAASRAAIKKAPNSLAGYQNLFLNYLQNKQPVEGMKVLDDASKLTKVDAEFLMGLAELYLHFSMQVPSRRKEANDKAQALLKRAESLEPASPALRLKLAEDYSIAGDSTSAARIYRDLLKKIPDLPGLRDRVNARLADIYLRGTDRKEAAAQLERIIKEEPTNARAYFSLAALAVEEKQLEKAAEYLSKAILLNPEERLAHVELGRILISLNKISDALAILDKARAKFPQDFMLEYLTGVAFGIQKAFPEAIKHYTAAEVIGQATHPEWLDQHFYFDLGAAYERKGDYEQSEKNFQKCLQLAPEFAEALNYLGYMWAEHGLHLEKAREMIEKAVKLEPQNAAFLDSLAWVLYKLEKPTEALDPMLKAIELTKEADATLYDHLGDIYAALKQPDKAKEAWQKSLGVEPNDQIQEKLKKSEP